MKQLLLLIALILHANAQAQTGQVSARAISPTDYPTPCTPGQVRSAVISGTKSVKQCNVAGNAWDSVGGAGGGDAFVADPLSQFAATTSLQLLGVISDETGTGAAVFGTSPSFTTQITTPKLVWTGSVQDLSGAGSPEGVVTAAIGSIYRRTDGGANTSAYVKESGAGNTGWVAIGASGGGLTVGSSTITSGTNTRVLYNNSGVLGEYTVSGSGNVAMTTAPTIAGGSVTGLTAFGIRSTGAAFDLTLASAEVFTAGRTLTFNLGDAARTLTLGGNATLNGGTHSGTNTGDQTNISGNAATVTTNANLTGVVTSIGNATSIANGAITNAMLANGAVANLSGTNTGDQTTVSGNAGTATALQTSRTIGGVSFDGTASITVATATGGFTVSGGALALGANDLTMTGSLAATGARVTKGWFTDVESTNMFTVGGVALTSTFQGLDSDLTTIAGLTATTDNFIQSSGSAWASRTPTQATATLINFVGDSGAGGTKGLVPAPGAGDAAANKFLKADGTWAAPAGAGTVTASGGPLTANSVVLGAGTTDTKVVAGIITDGTSVLTLGVAGSSVGSVAFKNATSGTITLSPVTGALGTVTLSLPAATDTLVGKATTDVLTNKTLSTSNTVSAALTWSDGVKQIFNPDATNAGLNVGAVAGDPSAPVNGDLWYDSTANELTAYINGANVALGAGGAGTPGGSNKQIQFNNSSAFGGAAGFEYQSGASPNVTITAQNAAYVPLQVVGAASNSAAILVAKSGSSGTGNIFEGQDSSGTVLLRVTSAGTVGAAFAAQAARDYLSFGSNSVTFFKVSEVVAGNNAKMLLGYGSGNIETANGTGNITFKAGTYADYGLVVDAGLKIPANAYISSPATTDAMVSFIPTSVTLYANPTTYSLQRLGATSLIGNVGGRTVTNASTLKIDGAPTQGANESITNLYALNVNGGGATAIAGYFEGAASNSAAILVAKQGSSGTGDAFQAQNSSGTVLAAVTSGGRFQVGASGAPVLLSGSGTPESAITAPVGSVYLRTDGGASTSIYIKESGAGNTGWIAK